MEIQGYLQQMADSFVNNDTENLSPKVRNHSGDKQKFQDVMDKQTKKTLSNPDKAAVPEKTACVQQVNDKRQQELKDSGNGGMDIQEDANPKVQNTLESTSQEAVEQVSEFVSELKKQICDGLELTEDELENLMVEMGLVYADLLQPVNLQNLTLKAADTEDRMVLLTNEAVGKQATELVEQVSDLIANAEFSDEELAEMITEVETFTEVEKSTQSEPVVSNEPSKVMALNEPLEENVRESDPVELETANAEDFHVQEKVVSHETGESNSSYVSEKLEEKDSSQAKETVVETGIEKTDAQKEAAQKRDAKETEFGSNQKNAIGVTEAETAPKEVVLNEKDSMVSMEERQPSEPEVQNQNVSVEEMQQQSNNKELVKEENLVSEQTLGSPKEQVGLEAVNTTGNQNKQEETHKESIKNVPVVDAQMTAETINTEKMTSGEEHADSNSENWKEEPKTLFQNVMEHMVQTATEQVESVQEKVEVARQVQEIVTQVVEQIKVVVTEDTSEMVIHLNPEHLGKVNLSVVAKEGHITAQFVTETEVARQALESQIQQLRDTLGEQGLKVDKVEVSVSDFSFAQENGANAEEQKERQRNTHAKALHRNLNLADMNNISDMTEEELLAVDVMRRNGGQIDFTA